MQFQMQAKNYHYPEQLAEAYLSQYFQDRRIQYPINPFQMLKDEGILFSLMDFKNLEGVYIPKSAQDDEAVVGINVNRPITRQRYTAAHELCHHFRDADRQVSCPIGERKDSNEYFAESFAAAILMPITELRFQVNKRSDPLGFIQFEDVLEIADYFGVSFESCVFRIAYKIRAIDGEIDSKTLKKRIAEFGPDKKRKARHMTYANLYAGLIDCYQEQLAFQPNDHAKLLFQSNYIYNDSRMEGLDICLEQASEIVTDLRLHEQNSEYCKEQNEAFMSIAGHYDMYQDIFSVPVKDALSVFDSFALNQRLFSHYPEPGYGGQTRQSNTVVLGAKFETVDYHDIFPELLKLDEYVKDFFKRRSAIPMSEYVKHVVRTHHRFTVIHPFSDGNGRTSRAFMNVQLVRARMVPIYIKAEDKSDYIEALSRADEANDYDDLYEIVFRLILRSYVDLHKD